MTPSNNAPLYGQDSATAYAGNSGAIAGAAALAGVSAVSWAAILAGAAAAAALSLILLILGVGLGLSSVSPWVQEGIGAKALGFSTIIWITFTQLAASGIGGYIAGRLRTRWVGLRDDEVRFRDTAHGLLAWAVASLATAALLTSVIGNIVTGGAKAGAAVASGTMATATAAAGAATAMPALQSALDGKGGAGSFDLNTGYVIDALFRPAGSASVPGDAATSASGGGGSGDSGNAAAGTIDEATSDTPENTTEKRTETVTESATETRMETTTEKTTTTLTSAGMDSGAEVPVGEITRIFFNALQNKALPPEDAGYVGQIVARQTGLSTQEAEKRVSAGFTRLQTSWDQLQTSAREAADTARKTSAYSALWLFVSLLIGAFVASLSATWGGRQRDL